MPRCFFAIKIDEETQARIEETLGQIRKRYAKLKWVKADQFHLTLRFLGDIDTNITQQLIDNIKPEIQHHNAFTLKIIKTAGLPLRKPKVLASFVTLNESLATLYAATNQVIRQCGPALRFETFLPHITLARLKNQECPLIESPLLNHIKISVNEIHLMQSDNQPTGSIYTTLASFPLG